jgi:Zn-dependent protease
MSMFGSFDLFRVFGIPVRVHTSLILFLLFGGLFLSPGNGAVGFVKTFAMLAFVFACVLLHELGHSLVALHHGVPVSRITLYPLGGVASLARMPREPRKEFEITLAGPLVNFALATLFGVMHLVWPNGFWITLSRINLGLGIFNLLPGFPMDGGRLLRAFLARKRPYLQATRIAVEVGRSVALILGVVGLLTGHFMLVFIAIFIYFAAKAELLAAHLAENPWERAFEHVSTEKPPERAAGTQEGDEVSGSGRPSNPGSTGRRKVRGVVEMYNDGGVWRPYE